MARLLRTGALVAAVSAVSACLAVLGGCFAVADLERFHPTDAPTGAPEPEASLEGGVDDPSLASTVVLDFASMGVHLTEYIEARIIDNQNTIQSRIMIRPLDKLGSEQLTIHVPGGIPTVNGPYRLDFYADHNHSGGYDGIGNVLTDDHAWRVAPLADTPANRFPHQPNIVQVMFIHNTLFTDIDSWPDQQRNPARDTGLSARVTLVASSLALYQGRLLQIRIADSRIGHTVAVYRVPEIPKTDLVLDMPGVLDVGSDYFIDVYIDANGNHQYDDPTLMMPSSDLGFRIPIRSSVGASGDAGADGGTVISSGGPVFGIDTIFDLSTTPYPGNTAVGEP